MGRILTKSLRCAPSLMLVGAVLLTGCTNGDAQTDQGGAQEAQQHPADQAIQANAERAATARAILAEMEVTPTMTIYKTPTCGCCQDWIDHAEEAGFPTEVHDVSHQDLALRKFEHDVAHDLGSCHTTVVDGYVVEGHVPADAIAELLRDRPAIAGIAVPGMPIGSPGMEGPRIDPYDVIGFDESGRRSVFKSY